MVIAHVLAHASPVAAWSGRHRTGLESPARRMAKRPTEHGSSGFLEIFGTEYMMTEHSGRELSLQPRRNPATVTDIMRPALTTVEPNAHVAAAAYLMHRAAATALVVVEDKQSTRPVGIITEADILRAVAEGKDANEVRIRAVMSTCPVVVKPTTTIRDAGRTMRTGNFRHLPVVDDGGLIGMVDITDVTSALLELPASGPAN